MAKANKLPKMVAVDSSQIRSLGYDAAKRILYINFKRGGMYKYEPITEQGYNSLVNAESVGSHFHQHIRGNSTITTTKLTD